ncbi:antitoxin VapB family protein [Candidatus Woesearchaeota archaeon]|nr:antitoxin VapB family protein [Candidatus Woesearchaeota archaeon]
MSTKTITLSQDAYDLLARRKEGKESFSDVVRKLAKPKSLLEFAGILNHQEAEKMRSIINEGRKQSQERAERLQERFQQ